MAYQEIIFKKEASVAIITLYRPDSFNAMSLQMLNELAAALEACGQDQDIRAVVLTGSGRAFCSGGDVKYFQKFVSTDPGEPIRQLLEPLNNVILGIRELPKPVIAAVNGAAGGAGMSLALCCDLRIASSQARFRQAYTSIGLAPDAGWSLFAGLLAGFGKASEMILLDPAVDAGQALAMGLVHRVVEPEDLVESALQMAGQLAAGATQSFALAKANLNHAFMGILKSQLEAEARGVLKASQSNDYQEGMEAFFAKRKPDFKGR